MRADLSETHDDLRSVARDILGPASPLAGSGSTGPPGWPVLAGAGWLGLEVPERLGGSGATFAEVAVVLGEMGRVVTASPYLGAVVLGVGLLNLVAPNQRRDDLLEQVAGGRCRITVALPTDDEAVGSMTPGFRVDGGRLGGRAEFVPDGAGADVVIVPALDGEGDTVVVAVDARHSGVRIQDRPVTDPTRGLALVEIDGLHVEADEQWVLARPGSTAELLDRGAVAVACDSLGLAQAALETTVAYACARRQFGRPIGSFQAVKHACADMLVQIRVAEELVADAVRAVCENPAAAAVPVSQAKSYATSAAVEIAGKAMQLHGGVGYTWERGIHFYLKRAALNRSLFGSPAAHRRRLAARYGRASD